MAVDKVRMASGHSRKARLNVIFSGPDGVGKTTFAKDYLKMCHERGMNALELTASICKDGLKKDWEDALKNPNCAVVLHGTEEEIANLFRDHPDIAIYFDHRVRFQELKGDLLAKILEKMAREEGFTLSEEGLQKMRRMLKDKKGGSSIARTLLNRAIRHQATRLAKEL